MPKKTAKTRSKTATKRSATGARRAEKVDVDAVLAWLKRKGTKKTRDGMARYAIPSDHAFGVTVGELRREAKRLGRDHDLAAGLWESGWYEARMLASFVDEPERVTPAQMDRWCREFDNWAICDTVCFALFDRTPHAWKKVEPWTRRKPEFAKRAGFALMWGLSTHARDATDDAFLAFLPLIERGARDDRNFVKKAVDMALRAIGKRNVALHAAAIEVAERLAASGEPTPRWVGKHAVRELRGPGVAGRLQKKAAAKRR